MTQKIRLSNEERGILERLSSEQIQFLNKIVSDNEFRTLKEIVNLLIDVEKNLFFKIDEAKFEPMTLYADHAYVRGGIAKLTTLLHIIAGSEHEALRREEERKKRKEA